VRRNGYALHGNNMRNRYWISIGFAAWLLAFLPQHGTISAQPAAPATASAKVWVGQTDRIEQELKSAEVVRMEDIGTGVTRPRRAYVKAGGLVESFTWKPLKPAVTRGYWESYKSEIAAYELDKMLALNMVPPVVEREMNGVQGAAVLWVSPTTSVKEMGGRLAPGRVPGHEVRRMQLFDNLIGNPDRNGGNILVDGARNIILIDHSRAFITKTDLQTKVERVDEKLWTAIEGLTPDALRGTLEPLIGSDALNAMFARRKRIQSEVDKLVARKGRSLVIIAEGR
jgi:hypothetical protein